MRADLQRSRDPIHQGLRTLGFPVIEAEATYFVNVDLASLGLNEDDETFCKRLVLEHKVAAIPVSAFYVSDPIRSVVRFCFAKARCDARCRARTARRRAQAGGVAVSNKTQRRSPQ